MLCDVCGRDNADNLTFCQDCGRRLQSGRVAPPTPPNGLPKVDLPRPTSEPPSDGAGLQALGQRARSRPEAPVFSFAPPVEAAKPAAKATATCSSCNSDNPPEYRFCVTCGAPLKEVATAARGSSPEAPVPLPAILMPELATPDPDDGAPHSPSPAEPPIDPVRASLREEAPPATTAEPAVAHARLAQKLREDAAAAAAQDASSNTGSASGPLIVGAPVVEIASPGADPVKMITCARCNGSCVTGTRFCKFCGAPLEETRGRRQPAMTSPATPTAKAHVDGPPTTQEPTRAATLETAQPSRAHEADSPRQPAPPTVRERASRASLVVIVEDGSEGKRFELVSRQTDIGRAEGDVVLDDDPYVSPRHARILWEGGKVRVLDLSSTNGVYLRTRKAEPLRDGDLLLLGLEVLQFQTVNDGERGLGHAVQHGTSLFGSPAATRRARLAQRTVEGITRDVYHLFRDETVIGRETGDIVFTADPFLSRRHAVVRRNPVTNEFVLQDLDSSNGTFLAIRGSADLAGGDSIRIGQHLFRLDLESPHDGDESGGRARGPQGS